MMIAGLLGGAVTAVLGVALGFALLASDAQRQRFSLIPLGLSSRRRRRGPRQHAVLRVSDLTSWQDWAQRLCRSARTTLLKQLPKHAEAAVVVTTHTEPHRQLSLEHFLVLYAHQRRVAPNAVVALLASIIRLFVAASMCGAIDELRDARTGALLAWLHVIAKGNTLRLMWWYSADPKGMLYFLAVRMNVQRALMMPEIEFVDAGPSTKSELMEIKERYGFTATMEWGAGHACSYAGDFCAHIPAADEVTKKVDATDGSEVGKTTAMESLAVKGVSKDVAVVAAAVTSDNENRCAAASARELKLQKKLQKQAARRARKGLLPDGSTPVAAGAEDNNEEVA